MAEGRHAAQGILDWLGLTRQIIIKPRATKRDSRRSIGRLIVLWSPYDPEIDVIKDKILSENYFVLRNITYDLTRNNGEVIRHKREVYDRGNGQPFCSITVKSRAWC